MKLIRLLLALALLTSLSGCYVVPVYPAYAGYSAPVGYVPVRGPYVGWEPTGSVLIAPTPRHYGW